MIAQLYDPTTFEYIGSETVFESPLEHGVWLLPSNGTLKLLPTIGDKEAAVFNVEQDCWDVVEDHRVKYNSDREIVGGTPYWFTSDTHDSEPKYMTTLGPIPSNATTTRPEKSLSVVKEEKISEINIATSIKITDGFVHKGYRYSYDRDDQQNFADTAVVAQQCLANNITKTVQWNSYDTHGGLVIQTFTPAEFLDVYMNGALAHKQNCMIEATVRKDKVQKATSISQVEKI